MTELDRFHLVIDRRGTAHAVAMTQTRDGEVAGWNAWCGTHIERGEDASYIQDCPACQEAVRIWRSRQQTEREMAERRRLAVEAAERARDLARRRR